MFFRPRLLPNASWGAKNLAGGEEADPATNDSVCTFHIEPFRVGPCRNGIGTLQEFIIVPFKDVHFGLSVHSLKQKDRFPAARFHLWFC